jgi:hypothetical protein
MFTFYTSAEHQKITFFNILQIYIIKHCLAVGHFDYFDGLKV